MSSSNDYRSLQHSASMSNKALARSIIEPRTAPYHVILIGRYRRELGFRKHERPFDWFALEGYRNVDYQVEPRLIFVHRIQNDLQRRKGQASQTVR